MDWIEITLKTTTEGADIAAQALYEAGVAGVVVEDPNDILLAQQEERTWDYIDDSILENMEEAVLVKAYLSDDASFVDKYASIRDKTNWLKGQNLGLDLGSLELSVTQVREEDWANNWKQYYKPIKVSDRLVIKPTWEPLPDLKEGEVVLEMDPGMAFGTGTHETTTLCIEAIDQYLRQGWEVVDIGCGTGVLAIASVLLGAKKATAIDLDTNAVEIAKENAQRNHVEDRVEVIHGDLLDRVHGKFDLAAANIIADVIIDLSESISGFLNPDGLFIASGIIRERMSDVVDALKTAGLEVVNIRTKGEWAVVVSKTNA